jgi:hypothetical protein
VRKELVYKMGGFHCIKADFWDRFTSYPSKRKKCINQKSNKQKRRKKDGKECKVFKIPHSTDVIIASPSLYILIAFTAEDPHDTCNNGFSI